MKQTEFYCVKCRKKVMCDPDDMCVQIFKNKKTGESPALRSVCPKCDTNLTKFIKRDSTDRMIEKYGKCRR